MFVISRRGRMDGLSSAVGDLAGTIVEEGTDMIKTSQSPIVELSTCELSSVVGGAGAVDFNSIRQQAAQHCPQTAARYANVDPSSVTRPKAQKMGESCLAEMGSFKASFARPVIENAINSAFPR